MKLKAGLIAFVMTSLQAHGKMEMSGQIFRRNGEYFLTQNYTSVEPSYRLRLRASAETTFVCLRNVRPRCPRYRVQFVKARRVGGVTEMLGAAIYPLVAKK